MSKKKRIIYSWVVTDEPTKIRFSCTPDKLSQQLFDRGDLSRKLPKGVRVAFGYTYMFVELAWPCAIHDDTPRPRSSKDVMYWLTR